MKDKPKHLFGATAKRADIGRAQTKFEEGLSLHQEGQLALAQAIYEQILKLEPRHFDALHLLGVIASQTANPSRAAKLIAQAIEMEPNNAEAHSNHGNALRGLNQPRAALDSYNRAIALKPDFAMAFNNRGNALLDLKQTQAALESYNRAIALKPDFALAFNNRGNALLELRQPHAAVESYDRVIALKPDHVVALNNRGKALRQLKKPQAALESYNRAIDLRADYAEAFNNRGNALRDLDQPQAALESYDRAIALRPDLAEAYYGRGWALRDLNQELAAIDSYSRALVLKPDYEFLLGTLLHAKMRICDWSDFDRQIGELLRKIQVGEKVAPPFPTLALTSDATLQRRAAQTYVELRHPAIFRRPLSHGQDRHERIRIGYYSAKFHDHPMSHLMAKVFESHDDTRFETVAFSFGPNSRSEMRTRLSAAFDRFYDVRDQSDRDIVRLSRENEVDVAVDLNGFMRDYRLDIFAQRAAPIQVSYLGYPATMAADYIDYLIADTTLVPQENRRHYTEKIAYLPNSYQPSDATKISERSFSRQELGLPSPGFVFCCFNNNYKITPSTFDGWMRILGQVNGSVLWLLKDSPAAGANLQKEAVRRGVGGERLVFAERIPLAEHLARHRMADLFIDTLPYNAHTTANDALWAGLPVMTCVGEAFASRVAASVLKAIGLAELITTTQQEYEALAIELATNPARLTSIRQKLERNRSTTPLFDTKLLVKHLEQAYTTMYERHQAGLSPSDFYVAA